MTRPIARRTTPPGGRRPPQSRRGGFTLIEMLIVVGIILVVVAAGTVSYRSISAGGRDRETRSTMMRLVTVATEYEALSGRIVNHLPPQNDQNPYSLRNLADFNWTSRPGGFEFNAPGFTGSSSPNALAAGNREDFIRRSIERFVWATYQVPAIEEMYGAFDDELFGDEDGNGFLELRDGWGNRIVYVAYVEHNNTVDDFLPRRDRPYFASAGPSGRFGDHRELMRREANQSHNIELALDAQDNIYSFDLD